MTTADKVIEIAMYVVFYGLLFAAAVVLIIGSHRQQVRRAESNRTPSQPHVQGGPD